MLSYYFLLLDDGSYHKTAQVVDYTLVQLLFARRVEQGGGLLQLHLHFSSNLDRYLKIAVA